MLDSEPVTGMHLPAQSMSLGARLHIAAVHNSTGTVGRSGTACLAEHNNIIKQVQHTAQRKHSKAQSSVTEYKAVNGEQANLQAAPAAHL